ncbi:hypothetical protein [Corynebacterium matruchotii]|uniref:hypothetical protein n=1 Tax=Corynebacterium matruchotii TaxID=43768 RepID=UPI003C6EAE7D
MTTNDITPAVAGFISDIESFLGDWEIDYSTDGRTVTVGEYTIKVDDSAPRVIADVTTGDESIGMTGDAMRAAALAAFPLARAIWQAGSTVFSRVEVDQMGGDLEIDLELTGADVSLHGWVDSADFTVTYHPLLNDEVDMEDLSAVLESAETSHYSKVEAWKELCAAKDFRAMGWWDMVEALCPGAHITDAEGISHVVADSEEVAIVFDRSFGWGVLNTNPGSLAEECCADHSDTAAAVLAIVA